MKTNLSFAEITAMIWLLFITNCLNAQQKQAGSTYVPQVGQQGKDVVWVPTPQELVDKMLEIADVTPDDFLIDLGSGDGRTVISAAKIGAKALGIEFNPEMVELSRENAIKAGVTDKAEFRKADLFETDLSKATVITMFLLPEINLKLRPRLLDLKPGTRVVSNTFTMGEWNADNEANTEENWNSWNTAYLWIIPAKVDGSWKFDKGELALTQDFQFVSGSFLSEGKILPVTDGKLRGNSISFTIGKNKYTGQVDGNKMSGTFKNESGGETVDWIAMKN